MIFVLTENEGRFGIYGRTLQISHVPVHGLGGEELWATKIVTCNLCLNSLPTKKCPTCRIGTMSEEDEDEYSAAMKNPYR